MQFIILILLETMVTALEPGAYSQNGFKDGSSEKGQIDPSIVDKTNGMIIAASLYAINSTISKP